MLAYQTYITLVCGLVVLLGIVMLIKAIAGARAASSQPLSTSAVPEAPTFDQFDPALLLSKSGKPLAGAALQNRLEALVRRQQEGRPLTSDSR